MSKKNGKDEEKTKMKSANRIILVAPLVNPVEFRIEPDDEKVPGMIMGAYIGGKMIARKVTPKPPPIVESQMRLKGKSFIPDIRPLVYIGIEEDPGGDIKAVLSIPSNPLKFEDLPDGGMEPERIGPTITLGMNVRLQEQRTFPTDMMKECCAHLDEILDGTEKQPESSLVITPNMPKDPIRPGPLQCVHNVPWRECRICRS